MKLRNKIFFGALAVFVIMQFFRIDKTNPPVKQENNFVAIYHTPEAIQTTLKNACYDCHSNESKYPWYSNVAPVSWLLKSHINEGREHLNFSEFGAYNNDQKSHVLEECIEEIEKGKMPMRQYILTHPEADLTEEEQTALITYFKEIIEKTEAL